MQENNLKNYLVLHLIVFIWGFTGVLGALITIEAIPLVFFRMAFAVFIIALYFLVKKKSFFLNKKGVFKFLFSGIIVAVHWIFFFKAIKASNVSVALVTMSTGAFFTSFIEPIFFKRKIKIVEILLGLLVILGLYIIFNFETQYKLGIIYALIASFLGALFAVLNGIFIQEHDANRISFYQLLFGTLFVAIYLLFTNGFSVSFFNLSKTDWFYLFILSSVCTAYAFIASVKVMECLSPYTVMLTINLEPIYAIVLALFIFGEKEKMNPEFYIGTLIVLGVVLLNGMIKNKSSIMQKFNERFTLKK